MSKKLNNKTILKETVKRSKAYQRKRFSAKQYCFEKQLDFTSSPARFKTAVCSRRAGKSEGIAADFVDTCENEQDVICLYITLTSKNARSIIWPTIKRILDDNEIPHKRDEVRLEVYFPETRSKIVLGGAKDEAEIEKYRGWKLRKVYIDEAQSFRPYIKYFIDDILMPALRDLRGSLALTGTPGPVPAGPFFDYSHSDFWEQHYWTAFDNPFMHSPPDKDLNEVLAEERAVKGIDENDPGYIRETFGKWVEDYDSLVFKFNRARNTYTVLPEGEYEYVMGIDIGYNDADAIAILAYSLEDKNVYLVEESLASEQDITRLVEDIKRLKEKYNPVKMVMDAGALGKKIQEEIRTRHALNIEAAEKTRKFEFIELLNGDLRTGKFKAFEHSIFEQDCQLVQWDRSRITNPKISDVYHSDINDAVLYAWRECRHFLAKVPDKKPKFGTKEWFEYEADQMLEAELEKWERKQNKSELTPEWDLNEKEWWEE